MARRKRVWPEWWEWELAFTSYTQYRMEERLCTEIDVRRMMEHASDCYPARRAGRWVIEARFRRDLWKVIVEPDLDKELVVVVTVHPVD